MGMKFTTSYEKDYLLSESPRERVFGRLTASSAADDLAAWVAAESERGTDEFDIMAALANFFVSFHASMAGSLFHREGQHKCRKLLTKTIEASYFKAAEIADRETEVAWSTPAQGQTEGNGYDQN